MTCRKCVLTYRTSFVLNNLEFYEIQPTHKCCESLHLCSFQCFTIGNIGAQSFHSQSPKNVLKFRSEIANAHLSSAPHRLAPLLGQAKTRAKSWRKASDLVARCEVLALTKANKWLGRLRRASNSSGHQCIAPFTCEWLGFQPGHSRCARYSNFSTARQHNVVNISAKI